MVKKAVAPAKKAGPATSKPASKAAAPVKAAAKPAAAKISAKAAPAKAAPVKATATKAAVKTAPVKAASKTAPAPTTTKHALTAKQPTAKPAPSRPAPSTTSSTTTKQASAKQPPKESVKQPIADAPAKANTKPTDPAAAPPAESRRAPATKKAPPPPAPTMPSVKGETKEGIKYTKDFDAKFLVAQHKLLIEARESLTGQAVRLEDEANSLIDDEMGDVQFDDESGEGDTMVVERERDLFLSARARQDIEEIDSALRRLEIGTYGYSVVSMRPIPRERLEAIPWATELTEEKVGGIGRR
jgi:RNA polymerase-binding transcription factor DksA